jgi:hypothetical protein
VCCTPTADGTPSIKGQVIGGRWKILHNFLRRASFADVFVGCGISTRAAEAGIKTADNHTVAGASPLCYLRNDTPDQFSGTVTVSLISFETGKVAFLTKIEASASAVGNEGSVQLFCPDGKSLLGTNVPSTTECGTFATFLQSAGCDPTSCYLEARVDSATPAAAGMLHGHNELLLAAPLQLSLPPIQLQVLTAAVVAVDGSVTVTVTADRVGVAVFVWLSTLAAGRFEPNGFMMAAKQTEVKFVPFGEAADVATLKASTRVEHLGGHLAPE